MNYWTKLLSESFIFVSSLLYLSRSDHAELESVPFWKQSWNFVYFFPWKNHLVYFERNGLHQGVYNTWNNHSISMIIFSDGVYLQHWTKLYFSFVFLRLLISLERMKLLWSIYGNVVAIMSSQKKMRYSLHAHRIAELLKSYQRDVVDIELWIKRLCYLNFISFTQDCRVVEVLSERRCWYRILD